MRKIAALVIALIAFALIIVVFARAQQPTKNSAPLVPARIESPAPKPLNPVASARIIEIETQIAHLRQSERDVLDGAGVPVDWQCIWDAQKIVSCYAPKPVASPSAK